MLALYLLAKFVYFKDQEVNSLWKSAFNLLRNEISFELDKQNLDTDVVEYIQKYCYFRGMLNNPSKSGTHFLRPFRRINKLKDEMFEEQEKNPELKHIIFIDDLLITGGQILDHKSEIKDYIKRFPNVTFFYLVLFANDRAIQEISTEFGLRIIPVTELTDESKVFSDSSKYFLTDKQKSDTKTMCEFHGRTLLPAHPLGFGNSQLLMGLEDSVPDNTLPIIWSDKNGWIPIFKE